MRKRPHTSISIITLGCSKNTVDSEILLRQIEANGLELSDDPNHADVVIVNTCGFIDAAKEESVNTILEAAERKKRGALERLYVAGCLSERYRVELAKDIPEVDRFFGVTDFQSIIETLGGRYRRELLGERHLTTPSHFAYLKISEGCDNPCSFCAIPLMRGKHVSTPLESVIHEAKLLALQGVRELVVIGQDTTYYGLDIYGERKLAKLLRELAQIQGIRWVRLMYAYPSGFPRDVLDAIREEDVLCPYIDIPVQHGSDTVLKSMRRGITRRSTLSLLDEMRAAVPGIAIRSTLIVGYPTETEREFEELMRFVEEARFDRLGVFTYSVEDDTAAVQLGDPVSAEEKERRRAAIMELQAGIAFEKNQEKIGKTMEVLLDRIEGEFVVARSAQDAPEVDNEVLIPLRVFPSPPLIGSFIPVRIVEANEYDLSATIDG